MGGRSTDISRSSGTTIRGRAWARRLSPCSLRLRCWSECQWCVWSSHDDSHVAGNRADRTFTSSANAYRGSLPCQGGCFGAFVPGVRNPHEGVIREIGGMAQPVPRDKFLQIYGSLLVRTWDDKALKTRFLANPGDVLKEFGLDP